MIRNIKIFSSLKDEDVLKLENNAIYLNIKKRSIIFHQGDRPEWFYALLDGRIKISRLSKEGREITIEIIDPGQFFGTLAIIRGFSYPATATALENSKIIKIPSGIFLDIFKKYPEINNLILQEITMRMKTSLDMLKGVALDNCSSRIAYQLLRLAGKYGKHTDEGVLIDTKLTRQQIAELAATTTETAIRVLSELKKYGFIKEHNRRILLKDAQGLSRIIEEIVEDI
ncbi:MAG: Crp/Fnr family transcriptional regulator [Syntrophorhabdaceae bacterium]|nr:Crp/Fnr family transcriptional regulator [Syntrophorhabdaceae bacterium]